MPWNFALSKFTLNSVVHFGVPADLTITLPKPLSLLTPPGRPGRRPAHRPSAF
jgi:hypothetical protein